ncbi:hypothetical protein FB451DRAFT_1554084 [Mycena latifolia]|nr:hypothetical protein FB451DRAFT_1554084 [Mycena latifolia]
MAVIAAWALIDVQSFDQPYLVKGGPRRSCRPNAVPALFFVTPSPSTFFFRNWASAMNIFILFVAWFFWGTQVRADDCAGASQAQPLYRDYSSSLGDHFYTTDLAEYNSANAAGYVPEGIRALVFGSPVAGAVQLLRLWSADAGDHLYTTSASEAQAATEPPYTYVFDSGPAMYIYPTQICGSVPLYRLHSGDLRDHFYTIDAAERDAAVGYADEGITGYVFPPSSGSAGTTTKTTIMATTATTTTTTGKTTTTTTTAAATPPSHSAPPSSSPSSNSASSASSATDDGLTAPVLPAPTTVLGSFADTLPSSSSSPAINGTSAAIRMHLPRLPVVGLITLLAVALS